jgi:phosphohistidine swiveling domain-containing protein
MVKKIQEYRKLMTRFYPLISYECWYYGERFGLPEISDKKVFFDVLFLYQEKQGAKVYYNFTDPGQQPLPLIKYFDKNLEKLKKLIRVYNENYKKLIETNLNKKIDPRDKLKKIYLLHSKLMPIVTATILISNYEQEVKNREVVKLSYDTRKSTENFIFFAIDGIVNAMKKIVPEKYEKYIYFLTYDEVLGKLPPINILKERKESYIYYQGSVFSGPSLDIFNKVNNIKFFSEKVSDLKSGNIIKGSSACVGKVTGRIKKITEVADMNKIKRNEILVTSMTTPDLMAVNKNFLAIITDEGGITCHAAIVARELRKPCIIGTKIATQVLNDGDLIEVDANNGIIKILKR